MVTGVEGVLEIGDDVAIGCGAAIAAYARVSIGSGTTIAPYVIILDTDFHRVGDRTGHANSSDIVIGRDVQLGSRVTVLRGSHVGDGAVVAAASVVSGIVPAGARVSGVPARARGERVAGETEGVASVPDIVMRSFALPSAPEPGHGPTEIPGWDSLGALTLLLALEDAFGISLSEDGVVTARTVADLARIVEQAMAAGNE
jgi:carbonic anhydrase/acetyltransferase-like protein (isoleucine patch superfamily)